MSEYVDKNDNEKRGARTLLIGTICKILKHIFQTAVMPFHKR